MTRIDLLPFEEFQRVRELGVGSHERLVLLADMCRFNALAAIKLAGSGHLGSSFSAMDIVVWLYLHEMNTLELGYQNAHRDIYFSSKGHDVPGLYAVLFAGGVLAEPQLRALRRYGGLDGHPDVGVRGIESNSGSLGMGISKARGMCSAKRRLGNDGRVIVLTGDGELQEGQNFEALQTTAHQRVNDLIVIVDHNKVQTDRPVNAITSLGDLESKVSAFGWYVHRCDGHDFAALDHAFRAFDDVHDRPKMLIADTIKGRGVSFMEHPAALELNRGIYPWHAGAPNDEVFTRARDELRKRIDQMMVELGLTALRVKNVTAPASAGAAPIREYVADAYGKALIELGERHPEIVVLDGDLATDCRVRGFEEKYPERFIENGIAEQDMVSMAAGLAKGGLLPVVNSFASFLASRANEQIYNAATEKTKIIYACHYAGLIPAGPGKSHQSVRDVSLFGALPNSTIVEPSNAEETQQALRYFIEDGQGVCVLRLVIGPSPRLITLPSNYALIPGRGVSLHDGDDALLFAYGPVMLHEALTAAELLATHGFGLRVVNLPWLNRVDPEWLEATVMPFDRVYVLEDHAPVGALGDHLLHTMAQRRLLEGKTFQIIGVDGFPACGTPQEALRHHRLDSASLVQRIFGEELVSAAIHSPATAAAYTVEAPQ